MSPGVATNDLVRTRLGLVGRTLFHCRTVGTVDWVKTARNWLYSKGSFVVLAENSIILEASDEHIQWISFLALLIEELDIPRSDRETFSNLLKQGDASHIYPSDSWQYLFPLIICRTRQNPAHLILWVHHPPNWRYSTITI